MHNASIREDDVATTQRAAGLGLVAYGIVTPVAFLAIGSPGGNYDDATVARYMSSGHWVTAFTLAYLGAFASLGLLPFASRVRHELSSDGNILWALAVCATAAAVVGWFLVGGLAVAFAEGGHALRSVPHPVVYMVSEMNNLIAVCSGAFFAGAAALMLASRAALPNWLRISTYVAGVCGILAAFFFPLFLFWLWAIIFGARQALTATETNGASPAPARLA